MYMYSCFFTYNFIIQLRLDDDDDDDVCSVLVVGLLTLLM